MVGGENGCIGMSVGRCMWWVLYIFVLYLYAPSCPIYDSPQSELNIVLFTEGSDYIMSGRLTDSRFTCDVCTHYILLSLRIPSYV